MVQSHLKRQNYRCDECGQEHGVYLLKPGLWRRLGLDLTDNLCQQCVEKRLGRKFRKQDFISRPLTSTTADMTDHRAILALDEAVQIRKRNAAILKSALRHGPYPDCKEVRIGESYTFIICKRKAVRFKTNPVWLREIIQPGEGVLEPPE